MTTPFLSGLCYEPVQSEFYDPMTFVGMCLLSRDRKLIADRSHYRPPHAATKPFLTGMLHAIGEMLFLAYPFCKGYIYINSFFINLI